MSLLICACASLELTIGFEDCSAVTLFTSYVSVVTVSLIVELPFCDYDLVGTTGSLLEQLTEQGSVETCSELISVM